jgi:peptidoglycan glycosyltransferase
MDKALRRLSIAGMLLIVVLMVNINYVQGSEADKLRTDPRNSRQYTDIFTRDRGKIMAGSVTLAESYKANKNDKNYLRRYLDNTAAFYPVTGVFMPNGTPLGMEEAYNGLLQGTDKKITVKSWFDSFVGKKPAGANVITTIDPDAQTKAYSLLKGSTDRRAGAAVIDIKTGAIKVLASYPSLDTTTVSDKVSSTDAVKNFAAAQKKKFDPTTNKADDDPVFPGSSFKIVVAAAMLEEGGLNENSTVETSDLILQSGQKLPNDPGAACAGQPTSLKLAFANSCNSTFGRFALQLGADKLSGVAKKFGFESPVVLSDKPNLLQATPSTMDAVHHKAADLKGDLLARTGIGQQDTQATPLQMAMVASAVANNGKLFQPYLVDKVVGPNGEDLGDANPTSSQAVSSSTASQLQDMMRAVVDVGTAKNLQGQDVAGKTGTAERGVQGVSLNDRWFVGFYPANSPKYAFAVMTEGSGFGATEAGPLAAKIVQAVRSK